MARSKTRLSLQQRRLLGELEAVAHALAEDEIARDELLERAKALDIPVERIAMAAGLSGPSGVYSALDRIQRRRASGP